ncbi:MAG: O-antigen ligase family protein [Chloroflexi bacterium]|nr:O-antigen ligase family protein [Chloroflexota bacterium]MCL5274730.1 O-antigen ligase family protein [Chloroflexota bacterium]
MSSHSIRQRGAAALQALSPGNRRVRTLGLLALCLAAGFVVGLAAALINPLILLGMAPVLVVGVWALRSDERSVWLLIAVIGILPRFAAPVKFVLTPTFLDLALILLIAAWFLRISRHPLQPRDIPIALPLLSLIMVAIVTFIVGLPNGALTPLVLRRFAELVISMAMVFVLVSVLRDRDILQRSVRIFIVIGALSALAGIILYILPADLAIRLLSALRPFGYPTGPTVLHYVLDDPSQLQRATGLWIDPNAYGGYLLVTGGVTLPQLFTRKPLLPKWLVLAVLGVIGLALVLTISRGAIIAFLFVAVLLGLVRYRRILLLAAIIVILILALPQTSALVSHFAQGFAGQDLATQMRFGEYKDAFRLIGRYPLLGVGFASTPDVDLYIGVSSMYLLVAQQMGLLGLSAFLITVVVLYLSALRARQAIWDDEMISAIWLGSFAGITGALISGIFDHYFFNIDFHNSVMLLWLVVAFAISSQLSPEQTLSTPAKIDAYGNQR